MPGRTKRACRSNMRGGAQGLLGSCPTAASNSSAAPLVAPKVAPFQKYNSAPAAKRFMQATNKQNDLNNSTNRQMKGGMAVLKLAGVTPDAAQAKTVTVPSFGSNPTGPVDATSNSQSIAQQGWNISERGKYDNAVSSPKRLGNQPKCAASGGRRRNGKFTKSKRFKKAGRGTRRR